MKYVVLTCLNCSKLKGVHMSVNLWSMKLKLCENEFSLMKVRDKWFSMRNFWCNFASFRRRKKTFTGFGPQNKVLSLSITYNVYVNAFTMHIVMHSALSVSWYCIGGYFAFNDSDFLRLITKPYKIWRDLSEFEIFFWKLHCIKFSALWIVKKKRSILELQCDELEFVINSLF